MKKKPGITPKRRGAKILKKQERAAAEAKNIKKKNMNCLILTTAATKTALKCNTKKIGNKKNYGILFFRLLLFRIKITKFNKFYIIMLANSLFS